MIPYSRQQITKADEAAVLRVLRSPRLTQGPEVERFEAALAEYVGARYAVAVNSGTAALHVALEAVGVEGEDVLVPANTFLATANAVMMAGGKPLLCDVDEQGMIEAPKYKHIPPNVIPVHYSGRPSGAFWSPGSYVIEDAAHALGAFEPDSHRRVGCCANSLACCFSFHPVKPITTGEGGAVTTNSPSLAATMRMLRDHGRERGVGVRVGWNYRMSDISAALGLSQLKRCDARTNRRRDLAYLYGQLLADLPGRPEPSDVSAWHLYPVRLQNRDRVWQALRKAGYEAQVHYRPLHQHPAHARAKRLGLLTNAERWGEQALSLPLYAELSPEHVKKVAGIVLKAELGE